MKLDFHRALLLYFWSLIVYNQYYKLVEIMVKTKAPSLRELSFVNCKAIHPLKND